MKPLLLFLLTACLSSYTSAQIRWDGGGGDSRWDNAANWQPDGVPSPGANVELDNGLVFIGYTVTLPTGNTTVELTSLRVVPGSGQAIELVLPRENSAMPGLRITGPGDALALEAGALLRNASGASSGDAMQLTGDFRIANGARYVHQTPRGNASLIDRLSQAAGTESGIFEFDVPGTAGYTVSLTGNTFGSLVLSADAAGGLKSYSGSGASTLQIRGNWIIRKGASLTSTLSANITLNGNLTVEGSLQLNPTNAGTTGRSILFTGPSGRVGGAGTLGMNAQFRNLEFASGSEYYLDRNLSLPLTTHQVLVQTGAIVHLQQYNIGGNGRLSLDREATIGLGDPAGISFSGNSGNIQTQTRVFSPEAYYLYEGTGNQQTGTGLPSQVARLTVLKPSGKLQLSQSVIVTGTLVLSEGIITSSISNIISLEGATLESPANAYGQTDQGWERSFVDGPVRWESSGARAYILPTGHGDVFAPVTIFHPGPGTGTYTARYLAEPFVTLIPVAQPGLNHISRLEYWTVSTSTGGIPTGARVALSWRPGSDVGATTAALADLRIAGYGDRGAGLRWEAVGTNPAFTEIAGYGWLESDQPGENFSVFTLGSSSLLNVLPIRQIHIEGSVRNGLPAIRYRLDGDGSCPDILVEHSKDGRNFREISGSGAGYVYNREYEWLDSFPNPGWNYYRIQAVSNTGQTYHSRVVSVRTGNPEAFRLFPNPAKNRLFLDFPASGSGSAAVIVHSDGKVLRRFKLSGTTHQEDIGNLPPGRYFLMIKHLQDWRVIPFLKH